MKELIKDRITASIDGSLTQDVVNFRKASGTGGIYTRDLTSLSQSRMIDISYWLWENYPMSKWIIELTVSFVLAEGLPWRTTDTKIHKILYDFWYDPVNRWDIYIEKHLRELFLFGELCLPVKVSPSTGRVRFGYFDPKQIKEVYTDPENVKIVIGVELFVTPGEQPRLYRTVLGEDLEDFLSPKAKQLRETYTSGDVFFFTINNVSNSPRGRGDLLTVADWIDLYENFLYDYAEKWSQQNLFVWFLKIIDGTPETIQQHVQDFVKAASKAGGVFGHNDKVEPVCASPDLKSLEVGDGARIIRNHILGGVGFPSHWYGGGEDANRATANEMAVPSIKILSMKQKVCKHILESMFDYQLRMAAQADNISYSSMLSRELGSDKSYEIITPELSSKDLTKFGAVIKNIADGLAVSESQQLLDKKTSREVWANVVSLLGKEVNVAQVEQRLKMEGDKSGGQKVSGRVDDKRLKGKQSRV